MLRKAGIELFGGSGGSGEPVLGIFQSLSGESGSSGFSSRGSEPLSANGGLTSMRMPVTRSMTILQSAFRNSIITTSRQRSFSPPRRLANISQRSSVYWIVWRRRAERA